jgi:ATP-dependent RNA helicase SUPV3L1/SUV3
LFIRKIKRIVFATVKKWDGKEELVLSTSQIKQIAGRAGRYGLHADPNAAGLATTLHPEDLPIVKEALETPLSPLSHAALPHDPDTLVKLYRALPASSTTLSTLVDNFEHLCRVPPPYKFTQDNNSPFVTAALDPYFNDLCIEDLNVWFKAPVQWRDDAVASVAQQFLQSYRDNLAVDLSQVLETTGLAAVLGDVFRVMSTRSEKDGKKSLKDPKLQMMTLETFHRSVVLYLWLSLRNPVAFYQSRRALELKEQIERAMDFILQTITRKEAGPISPFGGVERPQWISYKDTWQSKSEKVAKRSEHIRKKGTVASSI